MRHHDEEREDLSGLGAQGVAAEGDAATDGREELAFEVDELVAVCVCAERKAGDAAYGLVRHVGEGAFACAGAGSVVRVLHCVWLVLRHRCWWLVKVETGWLVT